MEHIEMGVQVDRIIKELTDLKVKAANCEARIAKIIEDKDKEYDRMVKEWEAREPYWEQGYSSDSIAAQFLRARLVQIQEALGVANEYPLVWEIQAKVLSTIESLIKTKGDH